jgi:hypothetical protein
MHKQMLTLFKEYKNTTYTLTQNIMNKILSLLHTHTHMWFTAPDIGARYAHGKPPRNLRENMRWSSIFIVLGDQQ